MKILIIDDDKLTLKATQFLLENLGHKTRVAESSDEAISLIVESDFDMIISDVMMPGISGLSLVAVLRSVYHCTLPIIMISTLNNKPLLEAAFTAGANDFIAKPFSAEELRQKINKYAAHPLIMPPENVEPDRKEY